ncbi:MAG: lysophospholipid acyltransferase family protein [Chloroflexi bacterium]|nr:lysophospholipid acyltransferase family protein [Chloroflexota bacterium]MCY3697283.1 lysophospholipid acyltransferase family protein [Chloroflexota bacterium]
MPTAAALGVLASLARVLPRRLLYALAETAAALALPFFERRRLRIRNNLQRIRPDDSARQLNRAASEVFAETARYYADLAILPTITPRQVLERHLHVSGLDHLLDAHRSGRGVVLTTAHISNPEVAVKALAALDIPAVALVEQLKDPRHLDAVNAARAAVGVEFLTATQTGVASALRTLRSGGVVCILWDRDRQGGGACVPFFGRQARFPAGAIDLAIRADAEVLPLYAVRRPGPDRLQFDVTFMPPLDLLLKGNRALDTRTNIAGLARLFEPIIAEHAHLWRVAESPWAPCRDTPWDDPHPREHPAEARP